MSVRSQEIRELLAVGETCGKLYVLKVIHKKEDVNIAKEESNLNLWHCRFGHLGMENISKLIDGNMVDGMKTTKDNVTGTCESCVMGKQHRTAYPKEIPYRAVEPFEIVHSDVSVLCMSIHLETRAITSRLSTTTQGIRMSTSSNERAKCSTSSKNSLVMQPTLLERKSKFYALIMAGNIVRWPFKNT